MADPAEAAPAVTGRRERNRQRIYLAALELFAERGYEATTMDAIAARAGLSRRTAFNHFPAKHDFVAEWSDHRRAAAFAILESEPAGPAVVARVRAAFRSFARLTEANAEETEQITLAWLAAGGPVRYPTGTAAAMCPWLAAGVANGDLRPSVDPVLAAEVLFDVYINVLFRWFAEPRDERMALTPQVDAAIDLVLRGLAAPP